MPLAVEAREQRWKVRRIQGGQCETAVCGQWAEADGQETKATAKKNIGSHFCKQKSLFTQRTLMSPQAQATGPSS